jgi:DNA mismatch repair protein MutS
MDDLTPAMRQYMEVKNKHPDCLVLFRMGDFYETFYSDAKVASEVLGITLTGRGGKNGVKVPLAGIPYHALDSYLKKLVKSGLKAVIVEQAEDPKQAKGLVKREIVRIVTPGTITEQSILDEKESNYIAAVFSLGIAIIDLSTGDFFATETEDLEGELRKWSPSEVLVPFSRGSDKLTKKLIGLGFFMNIIDDRHFLESHCHEILKQHFSASLDSFGLESKRHATIACGALLSYLTETQRRSPVHVKSIKFMTKREYLHIDNTTSRNLELLKNLRDMTSRHTLLEVLDNTLTPMGARELKRWIQLPLQDIAQINMRLDAVQELVEKTLLRQSLQHELKGMRDIERLMTRISMRSAGPRDLISLKTSLERFDDINSQLRTSGPIVSLTGMLPEVSEIRILLDSALIDDAPQSVREGGMIKPGFDKELDEISDIVRNGRKYLQEMEEIVRQKAGIPLKVGYNRVFGYFFEVQKRHADKVPEDFIRKQTTASGERYFTAQLKELEDKILHAEERSCDIEYKLFMEVMEKTAGHSETIMQSARIVAMLDSLVSLSQASVRHGYIRPAITSGFDMMLVNSRHPVLEAIDREFIPNDITFTGDERLMVITGPNMAGKSTVMRQVALISIMAHMGSNVPCEEATIPVIDRIFTRVGAHDDIMHGQSTFMVEMSEVALILNSATNRSLIIMDEIGRGTSTYDGVSIAWAVAEHMNAHIGAKTMFATHYHALTGLAKNNGIVNYNILVKEAEDDIIFMRKLARGGTDKSHGIHVARLAGMPENVIARAKKIQSSLEGNDNMQDIMSKPAEQKKPQKSLFDKFENF